MKQAVVVVSFGTTYADATKAIDAIEQAVERRMHCKVFRAFTSNIVRRRLLERDGIDIPAPYTLFRTLTEQGYDEIICLTTHVIPGIEYEMLLHDAEPFEQVRVARPLLWAEQDYEACVEAVMQAIPPREPNEALLLMGHGTEHFANAAYAQLDMKFRAQHKHAYVATVEGFPRLEDVLRRMEHAHIEKVMLMPFMIVAGDHARNDLAGDEEDSWKSILESKGFSCRCVLKGLGEIPAIAEKFAGHAQNLV